MAKKENIKNKSDKELEVMLKEKRGTLMEFRFKVSKGKAKNMKAGKTLRREIARILTEMSVRDRK
ncbi:50S ribosomal protein L29 [Patescibacteria group bacterium]